MERESFTDIQNDLLLTGRLVPVRREGKRVFARTLRYGEEDTGDVVHLEPGDELVIAAGDLSIDSREIDAQSAPGSGGYAPVANTVYTWYNIVGEEVGFYLFFFSLARRMDAAHSLWARAVQDRHKAKEEGAIPGRIDYLNALASAEMAVIALDRALSMIRTLCNKFCPDLFVPESVQNIAEPVAAMRRAFEHIDESSEGRINRSGEIDLDALSIFNQTDFIGSAILRYRERSTEYSLDFEGAVLSALLESRDLIIKAIDSRAASQGNG